MKRLLLLIVAILHNFHCLLQAEPFIYVSNSSGDNVSVVDGATNAIVATINVSAPSSSLISPDGQFVYVQSRFPGNNITVIDSVTNTVIAMISNIFSGINQLTISSDGQKLYGLNFSIPDISINVIDTNANTIIDNFFLVNFNTNISVVIEAYPDDEFLLVYESDNSNQFYRIVNPNSGTIEATIPSNLSGFGGLAISQDSNFAYVIGNNTALEILDLNSQTTSLLPVVSSGSAIGATPDGKYVVFHQASGGDLFYSLLDPKTNTIVGTITNSLFGSNSIAFSSDSSKAYVTFPGESTLEIIDLKNRSIITNISGFTSPVGVAVTPQFTLNLSGFAKKSRFLTQTALINTLAWEFINIPGVTIKEYRIFRDDVFLAGIANPNPAVFYDSKVKKGRTYHYRVEAILASGAILTSEEVLIKTARK